MHDVFPTPCIFIGQVCFLKPILSDGMMIVLINSFGEVKINLFICRIKHIYIHGCCSFFNLFNKTKKLLGSLRGMRLLFRFNYAMLSEDKQLCFIKSYF